MSDPPSENLNDIWFNSLRHLWVQAPPHEHIGGYPEFIADYVRDADKIQQ